MKILFAATEMFPWLKVGGLGDVVGTLPLALDARGLDVRVLLPGHPAVLGRLDDVVVVRSFESLYGPSPARLLRGRGPSGRIVYALDAPAHFAAGDLYAEDGRAHLRFAAFSRIAALLATSGDPDGFLPDVLHVHDWQTALAPVWVRHDVPGRRVPTVLTVHNLAYQGSFDADVVPSIGLPDGTFHMHGVEFYGRLNFLKGGLLYATRITTVSPTYAREITTEAGGFGLHGVLAHRAADLVGIVNGIDTEHWDPARSPRIAARFDARSLDARAIGRRAIAERFGLALGPRDTLFAIVSRLVALKGLDLVLDASARWLALGGRLAVLGRGEPALEEGFRALAQRMPSQVAVELGYEETLAEQLFAGADVVLVPSRSEPCGLTQLLAMRYGALPLVRRTGGLADTVVDATPETLAARTATGFVFDAPTSDALALAMERAIVMHRDAPEVVHRMRLDAMARDSSWDASAARYEALYRSLPPPG